MSYTAWDALTDAIVYIWLWVCVYLMCARWGRR